MLVAINCRHFGDIRYYVNVIKTFIILMDCQFNMLYDIKGINKSKIISTLRQYLQSEYNVRYPKGPHKKFDRETIPGSCPRVPKQNNYSDCGLYTLQYARSFFDSPISDFDLPLKSLANWFPQKIVRGMRRDIAQLIKELMDKQTPHHCIELPDIFNDNDEKIQARSIRQDSRYDNDFEYKFGCLELQAHLP